jgi:hypothetical protein
MEPTSGVWTASTAESEGPAEEFETFSIKKEEKEKQRIINRG